MIGDTLLILTPLCNEPPASNPATLDLRNGHPVLDFDDTTNESAVFTAVMPRHYSGGNLAVHLHFAMTSAVADTVDWDVAFERIGEVLDIDGDSFAAVQSSDDTPVSATCGIVSIADIAFSNAQADGVQVGEMFRVKVTRDAASDDAAGDAELLAVEIRDA